MNLLKLLLEINKIGKEIDGMKDYNQLGLFLYKKLKALIDFDFLSLGQIIEDKNIIRYHFYIEDGIVNNGLERVISKENSLSFYAVSNKRILLINDLEKEYHHYIKTPIHLGESHNVSSALIIPLYNGNKSIGFLNVQNWKKNSFDTEKVVLFKEIANYLANVLIKFENNEKRSHLNSELLFQTKSLLGTFIEKTLDNQSTEDLNKNFLDFIYNTFEIKKFKLQIYKDLEFPNYICYRKESGQIISESLSFFPEELTGANLTLKYENKVFGKLNFDVSILPKTETFYIFFNIYKLNLIKILEKTELTQEITENKKIVDALKKAYDNIKFINELGQNITATSTLKELGFLLHKELKRILGAELSIIIAKSQNKIITYTCIEHNKEIPINPVNMEIESSLAAFVINKKQNIVINDYNEDIKFYYTKSEDATKNTFGSFTNSLIYLPLYEGTEIIGAFSVQSNFGNFFDNYTIELIKNISSFVSIALANNIKSELLSKEIALVKESHLTLQEENLKLEKISSMDSLTKLMNRREFEKQIITFIEENKTKNCDLFLAIIDLDYFKYVNDTYGHPEGDKYLIEIAKLFKYYEGSRIKFARYGGDEFISYFYGPTKSVVKEIFINIREKLKNLELPNPHNNGIQSLTIGISNLLDLEDKTYENLYSKADKALYIGKEKGRNRIEFL